MYVYCVLILFNLFFSLLLLINNNLLYNRVVAHARKETVVASGVQVANAGVRRCQSQ